VLATKNMIVWLQMGRRFSLIKWSKISNGGYKATLLAWMLEC
jgi:hypothetical protein